jgi:hypothetical protein
VNGVVLYVSPMPPFSFGHASQGQALSYPVAAASAKAIIRCELDRAGQGGLR